jgi:DNA-binding MarR family transcriptional regulator
VSRNTRRSSVEALNAEVRSWQSDQERFDAAVAGLAGLHRTDWRCLDLLFTRGPMTAGQLASAMHLTTGAVTAVVDRLESAGWVRRTRAADDRRKVIVELTDAMADRSVPVYGPLMAENEAELRRYTVDELELITRFVRAQRALLARHTERLYAMQPVRTASVGQGATSHRHIRVARSRRCARQSSGPRSCCRPPLG